MTALGIGLPYFQDLPPEIYRGGAIVFVEVTPEVLCRERRGGALDLLPDKLAVARETCGALPIVVHGVELSIGSAHGCNAAYLDLLDRFQASWRGCTLAQYRRAVAAAGDPRGRRARR